MKSDYFFDVMSKLTNHK